MRGVEKFPFDEVCDLFNAARRIDNNIAGQDLWHYRKLKGTVLHKAVKRVLAVAALSEQALCISPSAGRSRGHGSGSRVRKQTRIQKAATRPASRASHRRSTAPKLNR